MSSISELLKKDWQEVKNLDKNRKFLVAVLFGGVFVLALTVGGFLFSRGKGLGLPSAIPDTQEQASEEVPEAVPQTTLALNPSSESLSAGKATVVSVQLSGVPVTAIDVVITYDPNEVAVSNITNGSLFSRVIQNKAGEGKIVYSASVSPDEPLAESTGEVFSFSLTPANTSTGSQVSLQFDPVETLTALDGENTLGTTVGGTYSIQ